VNSDRVCGTASEPIDGPASLRVMRDVRSDAPLGVSAANDASEKAIPSDERRSNRLLQVHVYSGFLPGNVLNVRIAAFDPGHGSPQYKLSTFDTNVLNVHIVLQRVLHRINGCANSSDGGGKLRDKRAHWWQRSRKASLGVSTRPCTSRRVSARSTLFASSLLLRPPVYTVSRPCSIKQ